MRFAFVFVSTCLLARPAAAELRYYSVTLQGKKAGYSRLQVVPQGAGIKEISDCLIKLTMLGSPMDVRYQAITTYARASDSLPTRTTVTMNIGPRIITSDCRFTGRKVDMDVAVDGTKSHKTLNLPLGC